MPRPPGVRLVKLRDEKRMNEALDWLLLLPSDGDSDEDDDDCGNDDAWEFDSNEACNLVSETTTNEPVRVVVGRR